MTVHMKSLVIFKVGDTFDRLSKQMGDFDRWIIDGIGYFPYPLSVIDPRKENDLPDNAIVAGAIITGSHSMVTDRAVWSENLATWLRSAVAMNIPIFGICYGHQLLAHALGGDVGYHPGGIELGSVSIKRTAEAVGDPLFSGMPEVFSAQVVHRQSVLRLPEKAVLLAGNAFEPHHAYRVGDFAWGVQFHPEFSADAMAGYIDEVAENSHADDAAPASSCHMAIPTAEAASLLPRFACLVKQRMN